MSNMFILNLRASIAHMMLMIDFDFSNFLRTRLFASFNILALYDRIAISKNFKLSSIFTQNFINFFFMICKCFLESS